MFDLEFIKYAVENSNLKMENARLKRDLAREKAMNWAFTSETERKINEHIHAIKCRDEVPCHIFLGKKEVYAMKATAGHPITHAPTDVDHMEFMGYKVIPVDKETFVDVSTVP